MCCVHYLSAVVRGIQSTSRETANKGDTDCADASRLKQDNQPQCDVLIIGSGAAGLGLALKLADHADVVVLSKDRIGEGATRYAQGGVSAVWDDEDCIDFHVQDTLSAGGGLCDPEVVRYVVARGQESINWLLHMGVAFTQEKQDAKGVQMKEPAFHLHREGGHSHRRILHAADSTGQAITTTLENRARRHPKVWLAENHTAIDLIQTTMPGSSTKRCVGAYVLIQDSGQVITMRARVVVLASGGAGKAYLYTSNPDTCTGDGIAMAWRAGCRIANMEFIQFHPTCLYHPKAHNFLISEALRGEGATLRHTDGSDFMLRYDSRGELAPRDIVARAIDNEMKQRGAPHVCLDISHLSESFVRGHFPHIYQRCLALGIDMCQTAIPVVPAAHYTCGGIMVDQHGRTDLAGLYAIGEVSHTGLHGANRMASNSLLECVVFAHAAFLDIYNILHDIAIPKSLPSWDDSQVKHSDEAVVVNHSWENIRRFMWDYVGIVRTDKRLQRARRRILLVLEEIDEYYSAFRITRPLIELRNLSLVAAMIIESAANRKESRGLHYSLDYPNIATCARDTILQRQGMESMPRCITSQERH